MLFSLYSSAQIPSYVPTNGLVGWWPLNSNAIDISGNNYNGVNVGAVPAIDRNGISNSCLYFDQDYLEVLNIPFNLQTDFTFSYWQKLTAYNHTKVIVDINENKICNGTPHIWQYFDSIRLGNCGTAVNSISMGNQSVHLNNWINYTFTSENGQIIMYKNGIQIFSSSYIWPTTSTIQFTLANGGNTSAVLHNQPSEIYLDDIGLWNRVLKEEEIMNLVNTNVGISDIDKNETILVSPIPAQNYIIISNTEIGKTYHFTILDQIGKIIKKGKVENDRKINIQDLNQGLYFLIIENKIKSKFKIVKN